MPRIDSVWLRNLSEGNLMGAVSSECPQQPVSAGVWPRGGPAAVGEDSPG